MKGRQTSRDDVWKQIAVLSVALLLSVGVGFIPKFTRAEQILFSLCSFTALAILDLLWVIGTNASRQAKEYDMWLVRHKADQELSNIRHYFAEIARMAHGSRDLFVSYFMKDIHNLEQKIKDAAEKQELRTASDFYLKAEDIFDSFLGDPNPVLRYTWPIRDDDQLFEEPAWWRFFEVTSSMAEQKKINCVCACLILDGPHSANLPRIAKLLDFFKTNQGQECRIIMRDAYQRICRENSMPTNYLDFGIYGERMLFRSEQYAPEYIGVYAKDTAVIQSYSKFFDTLWESSAVMLKNPSTATQQVTTTELIQSDSEDSEMEQTT